MAKKILAFLEQRDNKLKRSAFEVISESKKLADELGYEVEAVVIGSDIADLNETTKYGLTRLIHYKSDDLIQYSPSAYKDILVEAAKNSESEFVILSNSALGKDLAPRAAVKLNAGCIMDCTQINNNGGELIFTRPVFAGKALMELKFNTDIKILTLRPNVFKPVESQSSQELNIDVKEVSDPDLKTRVTELKKSEGKLDVAEADIIVSGGRGLKGPENFHLVEKLADALGAAVGASRAVVDAGWRPHGEQVGQTGKTVSPTLYVACGISGAIQHLAGMSSSKYIVAINKDKDAPIFSVADYGIAGDIFEILPALTDEINKLK
jgi:electron transfer flavoprotein alpha subunit